ncbi:MAG TPA: TMEM165/GDT1 family protein [Jiangellaceae bacterium]
MIFVAELGDKSQLMALTFASRYRPWTVLAAISVATAAIMAVSVGLGTAFSEVLPTEVIRVVAALAFFGFAAWTLWSGDDGDDREDSADVTTKSRAAFWTVGGAFFLAEFGDKTMLATVTLATQYGWLGVWLGATLGMVTVDAIAIIVGHRIGVRLPERAVRYGAAALFAIVGAWLLVEALI